MKPIHNPNDVTDVEVKPPKVESAAPTDLVPTQFYCSGLNAMSAEIYQISHDKGWWHDGSRLLTQDKYVLGTKVALIHSETSEMLEGLRKGLPDAHLPHRSTAEVEAADVIIRLMDLAGSQGWDLDGAITEKMAYNNTRKDHSAEARAAAGGKLY